jgi:Cap4 dsDNA endonuclease
MPAAMDLPFPAAPTEDVGASTAHRYLFQYCCAAARLLAALAKGARCELICEWHEDYLVVTAQGLEAVSVKHRENHLAAWTIPSLTSDDGNLQHLLGTFSRGGEIDCCLETNRGHHVQDLWSDDRAARDAARSAIATRLATPRAEVDSFLDRLQISTPPARDRQHIAATYAGIYAAPALDRLGIAGVSPSRAMRIAYELVAAASVDRVPDEAWADILTAAPGERAGVIAGHRLEARSVTDEDLKEALLDAARVSVPRLQALEGDAPPETTMSRKLEAGGLGPSVVDSARSRRSMWFSHRAQFRDIEEREDELRSLQQWVQDEANAAETAAIDSGAMPYGRQMYRDLMTRLRSDEALPLGTRQEDGNTALLAGAAFELTDDCLVWWSPRDAIQGADA